MKKTKLLIIMLLATSALYAQQKKQTIAPAGKPNIVVIMADDIGWLNLGCYNQGLMATKTPHLDKIATEGMRLQTIMLKQVVQQVVQTL